MSGDIREAHMRFAKELMVMYDDVNDYEEAKQKYLEIAKGGIPDDVKELTLSTADSKEVKLCDALVDAGFAASKSEARRMIQGNGVKVNSEVVNDINSVLNLTEPQVVQFGKNKFVKIK